MKTFIHYTQEKIQNLEQFIVDVVYDRPLAHNIFVTIFKSTLKFFSHIFSCIVQLRYWLYENNFLKSQLLGCFVIVVGNLTVGGTGKTPVVEILAKSLLNKGRKVAILSRGYKSKSEPLLKKLWRWVSHEETPPPKIVSDGQNIFLDSEEAGDEPYMLAKNLPGVIVIVDKNRVKAGAYAIKTYGVDTLILDDGFQYLSMKGWLNLLLIDKTNPFGNHLLLPRGILREPIKHLRRASYIFLTKSDGTQDKDLNTIIHTHRPGIGIIECTHKPQYFQSLFNQEKVSLDSITGKSIAVLSAIASPIGFEQFLEKQGGIITYKKRFLDHHRFSNYELESFLEEAQSHHAEWIIVTEKDAVRIPHTWVPSVPIYYLKIEIDILSGQHIFNEALGRVCLPYA